MITREKSFIFLIWARRVKERRIPSSNTLPLSHDMDMFSYPEEDKGYSQKQVPRRDEAPLITNYPPCKEYISLFWEGDKGGKLLNKY